MTASERTVDGMTALQPDSATVDRLAVGDRRSRSIDCCVLASGAHQAVQLRACEVPFLSFAFTAIGCRDGERRVLASWED
jgi:hypothetical protein